MPVIPNLMTGALHLATNYAEKGSALVMSDYTDTLARAVTRYGADSPEVDRLLPELHAARRACREARWPELHRDDCEWCAYVAAGGARCHCCNAPTLDEQEQRWGICGACHDDGISEAQSNAH